MCVLHGYMAWVKFPEGYTLNTILEDGEENILMFIIETFYEYRGK